MIGRLDLVKSKVVRDGLQELSRPDFWKLGRRSCSDLRKVVGRPELVRSDELEFAKSSDIEESRLMTNVDGYDVIVSRDV